MRKFTAKHFQKGTSLIEVILYIALFSIIIIVVVDLLITSGTLKTDSESQSGIQTDATFITSRLNYEIQEADSILTPILSGPIESNLVLTNGTETHTISLSGTDMNFQKTVAGVTTTANLNTNLTEVSLLTFQPLGNISGKLSIKINFVLSYCYGRRPNGQIIIDRPTTTGVADKFH